MKKILRMNDGFLWLCLSKKEAIDMLYSSSIPIFSIYKDGTESPVGSISDIEDAEILTIEIGYENQIQDFIY